MKSFSFTHLIPDTCFNDLFPESFSCTVSGKIDGTGTVHDLSVTMPLSFIPVLDARYTLEMEVEQAANSYAHKMWVTGELMELENA